jgi:hypothetical protein
VNDRHVLVLWALALGLITYREFRHPAADAVIPGIPRPWAYTGASAAFAVAAIIGEVNGPFGTMLAAAWVLAIYLGYFGAPGGQRAGSAGQREGVKAA